MLLENRDEKDYEEILAQIVKKLESQGYDNIKADIPGYEKPPQLKRQGTDDAFWPDATAVRNGRKSYFEIAKRTKEEIRLVGKWKLLSTLAQIKNGELQIFIPRGELSFTRRITTKYNLNAELIKLF